MLNRIFFLLGKKLHLFHVRYAHFMYKDVPVNSLNDMKFRNMNMSGVYL